ncbi:MAG TPA: hypothetical protein DCM14_06445 [Clostridiales bacterium UBA8153]|nr:hypothetical protein [Clostridiales bacterium UBA8153]
MKEVPCWKLHGFPMLLLALALIGLGGWMLATLVLGVVVVAGAVVAFLTAIIIFSGLKLVGPNHGAVIVFFGKYLGSIRQSGLWFVVPWSGARHVSLQVRNFKTIILKVNDAEGSPVEIAAVIVFRVVDTEKALLEVENYGEFMEIQSKTAIRHIAAQYPYDLIDAEGVCLMDDGERIARELAEDLQERLSVAGLEVLDARITHLAYATEIASAMLQRQQAKAILAAKQIIVDGAVGIAQLAIDRIGDQSTALSHQERIALINNLLVSVVSEQGAQPVINVDLSELKRKASQATDKDAKDEEDKDA